jgi:hypothetical protein
MKMKLINLSVASFLLTSVFAGGLVSCGQKSGDVTAELKHQIDSGAKSDVEKARAQCFATIDPIAVLKKADGKNKFCSETLAKDSKPVFAFKGLDRSFKLARTSDSKLAVTINAGVKFSDPSLNEDLQKKFIKNITDECMPNLENFWNKSNILVTLSLAPYSETDPVDQTLKLDLVGASDESLASKVGLQISEWPESSIFSNKITPACQVERDKNTSDGESKKDTLARSCVKKQNQKFCLALNKMLGYWVGAEDLDDPKCEGIENKPAVGQKPSFMSYSILASNNLLEANDSLESVVPNALIPPEKPVEKVQAEDVSMPLVTGAVPSEDLNSTAQVFDALNSIGAKAPPVPDVPAPQDTSADPSYQIWTNYNISPENLKSMFDCDFSAPIKNIAQAQSVKPPIAKPSVAKKIRK